MNYCKSGRNQSPIDIKTNNLVNCQAACDLVFYYNTSDLNVRNIDNEILITYDPGSYVTFNNETYELEKISFTNPSSHKLDGSRHNGEMHLYHYSPATQKMLIIAVWLEINEAVTKSKDWLDMTTDYLPGKNNVTINHKMPKEWNIYSVIPDNKAFYNYDGSLLKKPCTEIGVQWIVFENPVNCSSVFYKKLSGILGRNAKAVSALNGRTVFNSNYTTNKNKHNQHTGLKCLRDSEFKEKCTAYSDELKAQKNDRKKLIIILITLLLCILIIYGIIFMYNKGWFDGIIRVTKGFMAQPLR